MPTFPTYRGNMPDSNCLEPSKPGDYLMLAYWVFFRPSALKYYLYQADARLYNARPKWGNIRRAWRVPAYHSLYLMVPGSILWLSVLIGLPLALLASRMGNALINWQGWGQGLVFGLVNGVALCAAFSLLAPLISVAAIVAVGTVLGVAGGIAIGLSSVLTLAVTGSIANDIALMAVAGLAWGLVFSLGGGVAADTPFLLTLSMTLIVLAFGIVQVANRLGVAAVTPAVEVLGRLVLPALAFIVGALRILLYPFELVLVWASIWLGSRHPLAWDELIILPLPGTLWALRRELERDETRGLRLLADVARNPFQRWAAQLVLQSTLRDHARPLAFLYDGLLRNPDMAEYAADPLRRSWSKRAVRVRQLLLGGLGLRFVERTWHLGVVEELIWSMTASFRSLGATPLTNFVGLLYDLLYGDVVGGPFFDLSRYEHIYAGLGSEDKNGEIARSFRAMAAFLSYRKLRELCRASEIAGALRPLPLAQTSRASAIRPKVLDVLEYLGVVGSEIAAYYEATGRVRKLTTLARAYEILESLEAYVIHAVIQPERAILSRIIARWQQMVVEEGGKKAYDELRTTMANPYVVGNPVTGNLFVGRAEIMRRLEELWKGDAPKPSVVLCGQRYMGKSSILQNLSPPFDPSPLVVDFNVQRIGLTKSTGDLLCNLALAIYDGLDTEQREAVGKPQETPYDEQNPYMVFDRFLQQVERTRLGRSLIVTVDEFELVETMIDEGRLEPHLLDFWRGLIQTYPWFIMVFAGLTTLREVTQDYWQSLYGSVLTIRVTFLEPQEARQLVTEPMRDFVIEYEPDAVERIIELTHGQPYLIQLIGHTLFARFNQETYEQGTRRKQRFTLDDVNEVVNAPAFYRDGSAYFQGIWDQAEKDDPPNQTATLRTLASAPAPPTTADIAQRAGLAPGSVQSALEALERFDVVEQAGGRWGYTVELMRRWVADRA